MAIGNRGWNYDTKDYAERLELERRLRDKQPGIYLGAMTIEQLRAMVDDDGAVDKQAMSAVEGYRHGE
jgi:hypothetical protein